MTSHVLKGAANTGTRVDEPQNQDGSSGYIVKAPQNRAKMDKAKDVSPTIAYFKLWSFASPLDTLLRFVAAIAGIGAGVIEPLQAIIFGRLVNFFNAHPPLTPEKFRGEINKNALYFVYLFLGKFACIYIAATLFNFTASNMTSRIRLQYLREVLRQPISSFDKTAPGSIAASLSNDTNAVQIALAEKVGIVFQALSMMLCGFIIAFTKAWKLTLATATLSPYQIITTSLFVVWTSRIEAKTNEILNNASGVAEEALSSILNITAMGAAEKIVRRYDVYIKDAMRYFQKIGPLQACIYGNMFFAQFGAYALALFYGAKLVDRGDIDGGTVVTVIWCVILASNSMGYVAPIMPDFSKGSAAAQQIVKMIGDLKHDENSRNGAQGRTIDSLRGDLEFSNVSFSYPERATMTILDNVNVRIPSNKTTAIVGHSGSGKSTIVALLEKWYTTNQGVITIDGHDINDLDLSWWRTQIGLVQQEPMLFNDTIYNNVLNGLRGPDLECMPNEKKRALVIDACKHANAHNFIQQLPNGYDTSAGERADLLSGGQKQRIAIARSIVSDPKVLLLDEATSALDYESERAVSAALEKASQGRTTVMIAHKLSTVVNADNIVVLNNGALAEQGTHCELVALRGHYWRLLQAQSNSRDHHTKESIQNEQISKVVSQQLTYQSTERTANALQEVTSLLESQEVSRRYSIFWCMYNMYLEHPSLIWPTLLAFAGSLLGGAMFPVQAVIYSRFVTIFSLRGSELIDQANFWALMFFVLGLTTIIGFLIVMVCMGLVAAKFGRVYRNVYLKAMLGQDIGFFQAASNTSGGLSVLLAADGTDMTMLFGTSAGLIVFFAGTLIACCVLAIAAYWKLGLVSVFGCLPVLLTSGFFKTRLEKTAQDRCAAAFLESARYSTEAIAAIRTVSSLTMENKVERMYRDKLQSASVRSIRQMLLSMVLYANGDSLTLAAGALVFWYGGRLVSFGELSTTQFFLIFAAVIFGGTSAGIMFGFTGSVNKAHAALNRILYLGQSKPIINSSSGLDPLSSSSMANTPTVEFHNVHFRYPSRSSVSVLRSLSFSVERGSHVCIVGPSGCGKSTIIALLERFYNFQPCLDIEGTHDAGQVTLYGRPISEWDIHKLRNMMGLVAQDTTLYQGTLRDNILIGVDENSFANEEEIKQRIETACKQANIHSFITSLPQSYETDIGARGVALSGGQRQRLALARCLIRNPEILLLDEATSALDPESEAAVREALKKARREREGLTIISVTHQVEGMRDADKIVVVDKGFAVEDGSWEELMGRRGRLWSMVVQGEVEG